MEPHLQEVPVYLKESCSALGMKDPQKIRQILQHLSAIQPATNPAAETIPEALDGIRGWVTSTIALHKVDMARVAIAVWFGWKLCLWKPDYVTLDHFYTHGCGFSPAQGDRLRHHGGVLVALALADIPQMPVEKQARAVRKLIPDHMVGDFFRKFYSTYDPAVHYSAIATKKAAQRYVENKILEARKRRTGLETKSESDNATTTIGEGDNDETLMATLPTQTKEQAPESVFSALPSKTAGDVQGLLEIVAPDTSLEEFAIRCIDSEFHRIRRKLDSPCPDETPLLDALAEASSRHKEAVERLFLPKLEAFILHLITRESRRLLKQTVGEELAVKQPEAPTSEPTRSPEAVAAQASRKKSREKKLPDPTPELPFGPEVTPAEHHIGETASTALQHNSKINQNTHHE